MISSSKVKTIWNMFNASSSVWNGSLEKIVKSRNSTSGKSGKALKRIFNLPIATLYIELIIETGVYGQHSKGKFRTYWCYITIL